MTTPAADLDSTMAFLQQRGAPWNLTSIDPDKVGVVVSATFTDPAEARAWLQRRIKTNLYFASSPAPSPSGKGGRVARADIPLILGPHADLDVDKEDNDLSLDERKARKVEELNTSECPPTFIIDTGGGLAGLWQLAEPLEATPENIEWVEAANRWMVERFGADKITTDLGRLLRLPGTVNYPSEGKRARGREVAPTKLLESTGLLHHEFTFGQVARGANSKNVTDAECDPRLIVEVNSFEDLRQYGLPADLRALIINGHEAGEDRSDKLFHAACWMIRCGVPTGAVAGVLLNSDWLIGEHVREHKARPVEVYAMRQAIRAMRSVSEQRHEEFSEFEDLADEWLQNELIPVEPEDLSKPPRFKRYSIMELIDLPDPIWTVEGLLLERSFAMLYGAPKSFKTFCALDMALCIATGIPFHGHAVKQGTVTYIAAEGNPGETRYRVLVWCREHNISPHSLDGKFKLVINAVHLDDIKEVREFLATDPDPSDVVVVDTVNRAMMGDESSTKDMTAFVRGGDALRKAMQAAILAVHHSGVNSDRERGSTALRAAVDTRIKVSKSNGVVTFHLEDQRAGPDGEKMYFQPVLMPVRGTDGPESIVLRLMEKPKGKDKKEKAVGKVSTADLMLQRIADEKPETWAALINPDLPGFTKTNVYKIRDQLVKDGLAEDIEKPVLAKAGRTKLKELRAERAEEMASEDDD
jgi:hypothetical protein